MAVGYEDAKRGHAMQTTKTSFIGTRLSEKEKDDIEACAKRGGESLASFVRRILLEQIATTEEKREKLASPLLDTKEVCKALNISRTTVANLVKAGKLPYIKIGNVYRFDKTDIDHIKNERKEENERIFSKKQTCSTHEAAVQLNVSDNTVLSWIKSGKLPAEKVGSRYKIKKKDLNSMKKKVKKASTPQ